jgi:TonB family protein
MFLVKVLLCDASRMNPSSPLPVAVLASRWFPEEPSMSDEAAVVEPNGVVGDVRVVKSLHPDLDEAAIASARQSRFKPGRKSGQEVAVIVEIDVSFARTR